MAAVPRRSAAFVVFALLASMAAVESTGVRASTTGEAVTSLVIVGGPSAVSGEVAARAGVITGVDLMRLSGANRFATAAAVAEATFPNGVDTVYLATSDGFADALSASTALAGGRAALLLTAATRLPEATTAALQRLEPSRVIAIGGRSAIAETVLSEARAATSASSATVTRIAGATRYATSAAVAAASFPRGVDTVYLATGNGFADALAASTALAARPSALLLTDPDSLPADVANELDRLNPTRVFMIGGAAAVSDGVVAEVRSVTGVTPVRLAGSTRYDTARRVSQHAYPDRTATVYLATGRGFTDALAAAQAVILERAALLLTDADVLPRATAEELARLAGTTLDPDPQSDPATDLLARLVVAPQNTSIAYDRDDYPHWSGSCPNVRHRVLERDSEISVVWRDDNCLVISGRWTDPWTGQVFTLAADIDIDHHVPLANAHRSGAWAWDREKRRAFANDLDNPAALRAMGSSANRSKGDKGPDEWRPPLATSWCTYATDWATIKITWNLTVTAPEYDALDDMLETC